MVKGRFVLVAQAGPLLLLEGLPHFSAQIFGCHRINYDLCGRLFDGLVNRTKIQSELALKA